MKVLVITGDKSFGPGHPRYDLQASAVTELRVVYWGRGSLLPKLPSGYFDVVTAQDPFWRGLFALVAAKRLNAKLNVQVHADLSGQSVTKRLLAKVVLRRVHSVRVVSEKIKLQVERMGVRAPIHVLPVFVDIGRFKNIVRQPHEQKTILWIGRFEPEKNPEEAVAVWKKVREVHPTVALVVLGAGSLRDRLDQLRMQSVRGMEHVSFEIKDWQDPAYYLARADVVLCTSQYESWGASIVEALAAGVPVVAPDVGVAKEAGAIVVPQNQLKEAVLEVLQGGGVGVLKLSLPNAEAWAQEWKKTLQ